MPFTRSNKKQSGGGSEFKDLTVVPYNVVNGTYSQATDGTITYNISTGSGYEGMSAHLMNLEVGKKYLITFDVNASKVLSHNQALYSWKCGIYDGDVTTYSTGTYASFDILDGEECLQSTKIKKSFIFIYTPSSTTTSLVFSTSWASSNMSFTIDNFKCAELE